MIATLYQDNDWIIEYLASGFHRGKSYGTHVSGPAILLSERYASTITEIWKCKRFLHKDRTPEECFMLALEYIGKIKLDIAVEAEHIAQVKDFAQEIVKDLD